MGMGIESVRTEGGRFEILIPAARVSLGPDGLLSARQRIGADRSLFSVPLPANLAP